MANYSSKTSVPVAVKKRSQQDLSHITITSQDFGVLTPISCQYLVPGDEFHINVSEFTRLLPLPNPTFAKVDSVIRAFAVPISYIWFPFNDFISGNTHVGLNGELPFNVSKAPSVEMRYMMAAFTYQFSASDPSLNFANLVPADSSDYDFVQSEPVTGEDKYKLTDRGRKVYKWLLALGYNMPLDYIGTNGGLEAYQNEVSVLPILAFYKFYLDWVVPARYLDQYNQLRQFLDGAWTSSTSYNSPVTVAKLLNFVPESFLDNDYFTSAWKYPASPEHGISTFNVPDTVVNGITVSSVGSNLESGAITSEAFTDSSLSSLSLQSLGALQSMLNRGMITGNKIKDWLKTEFGIEPSKDALRTSTYLGMSRNTVTIGDVFATSDTEAQGGTPLGAYAGKGANRGSAQFNYKADQHSILIVTCELIPKPLYFQGLRPLNQMVSRFDFFQPEFDNVGVRAISRRELYNDPLVAPQYQEDEEATWLDGIFGFAPQYANLKVGYDNIIGDFRLSRFRSSLQSWFLARRFENPYATPNTENITSFFSKVLGTTQADYDKMFSYMGNDIDHFYSLFAIDISANRPMVSISDALQLPDEQGSRKVAVSTNNNPNV